MLAHVKCELLSISLGAVRSRCCRRDQYVTSCHLLLLCATDRQMHKARQILYVTHEVASQVQLEAAFLVVITASLW